MIYVCEYDGTIEKQYLAERAKVVPLSLEDGWTEGKRWEKQRERVIAWLLLQKALRQDCGLPLEALEIRRSRYGKPFSSTRPDIHFNLSHCSAACACIVSRKPAGIDIERKFPYRESLERRICHEQERQVLEGLPSGQRREQQHILWSMKESFVKKDGRGLGFGMSQVNLSSMLPVLLERDGQQGSRGLPGFFVQSTGTYTLAVCSEAEETEVVIVRERELCGKNL